MPPPLIFALVTGAGIAMERGSNAAFILAGGCLAGLGLAIILASLGIFRRFRVRPEPWQPAARLLVDGIYRYSRNPMYLGMALFSLGLGVGFSSLPGIIGASVAGLIIHWWIIPREEAYLLRTFGEEYTSYCRSVSRWLPAFSFSKRSC